MPYLHFSITTKLSETEKESLIKEAGQLIELLPGKSENVLMIRLDENTDMYFRGQPEKCAYVSISLYMTSQHHHKQVFANALSESICRIASIEPKNLFMTFSEHSNWVANGELK